MPRVVPSQVIEVIDQLFPTLAGAPRQQVGSGPQLAAIINLAREVPTELLTLSGQDLSDYCVALSMMHNTEQARLALQRGTEVPEYRGVSPMLLLRNALAKCSDEVPSPLTVELTFIADIDLRESIRKDISAANQDMANGEWKGATVLAGSATEALLLWAIQDAEQQKSGTINAAASTLVAATTLPRMPNSNPERWTLFELIEVALQMTLITGETATQTRLGKDFRNLIHPGRAARLGQVCDRATALSALAAVEHVVRDLTP